MMSSKKMGQSKWAATIAEWWRYEPIRHAKWEVLLLRLGLVWVVWITLQGNSNFNTQPHPNGIARWMDLTFLSDDTLESWLRPAAWASLAIYVVGVPAALSLLLPLLLSIGMFTLKNSQGAIGHGFQVAHLGLLAAWLAGVWHWMALWRKQALPNDFTAGQLELDWARQALAAGYVVSAITKLIQSGGLWFRDAHYFALHIIKSRDMKYYGTLDESLLKMEWLPDFMMQHPLQSQLFFGLALPLELLAFAGCRNRRLGLLFGLGLIAFHLTVKQLTELNFIHNMQLLMILMVNPLWWVAAVGSALWRKSNPQS
jgi:hypothetical protein